MVKGFQMDTEINRIYTLKQTKQAALHALQNYEISWNSIHFIQISEHFSPSTDFSRPSWGIHTFERDWAHLQRNHGQCIRVVFDGR